eukprot:365587-Chlamydomonas_euryale.AAC.4
MAAPPRRNCASVLQCVYALVDERWTEKQQLAVTIINVRHGRGCGQSVCGANIAPNGAVCWHRLLEASAARLWGTPDMICWDLNGLTGELVRAERLKN